MRSNAVVIGAVLAVTVTTLSATQNPMRPGRWEVTATMEMPGMPKMPPMTTSSCITAEALKKDPAAALAEAPGTRESGCTMADYKITSTSITWKVSCSKGYAMTGEGTMTFKGIPTSVRSR